MGPTPSDSNQASPSPDTGAAEASVAAQLRGGFAGLIGLCIEEARADLVRASWVVDERHLQPHGIVHGGVYCSVVETCCSVGAMLASQPGRQVVGVENQTSFIRPVRAGRLLAEATPVHAGRRSQLWRCRITDAEGRLVATGQLRTFGVEPRADAAAAAGLDHREEAPE